MTNTLYSFAALKTEIHDALRLQHPEWIEDNGQSAICDSYEARLAELLDLFSEATDH
jgi:hypothetical protein